jgi:hypothetical protein
MMRFSARLFCLLALISVLITACQKDESIKKTDPGLQVDTSQKISSSPGNYLASKGTLTVKVKDSTYTFNAEQDSVAFVNINIDGEEYYGITAINRAHTVSFGISSSGVPIDELSSYISGCQFLLKGTAKNNLEYTLIRSAHQQNFGTIAIEKYNQDTTLAKGTFHTFLATDTKSESPNYTVDGSFELKIK